MLHAKFFGRRRRSHTIIIVVEVADITLASSHRE
jgi:hypothetical protein